MTRNRIATGRKPVVMSARLWSKRQQWKDIEMKEHNIDDLLKAVSSDLIINYEKKLGGVTLSGVNEEYKTVTKDPSVAIYKWLWWFMFTIVVGLFSIFISAILFRKMMLPTSIALVMVLVSHLLYLLFFVSKKAKKDAEILRRCTPILKDFRVAVESLNPLGITIHEYNEKTARQTLVTLAVRVLDAEIKFDASRKQVERRTWDILNHGNWLEKCQKEFDKTSQCVRDFGVRFSPAEVFAEAEEHLVQGIQLIRKKPVETKT